MIMLKTGVFDFLDEPNFQIYFYFVFEIIFFWKMNIEDK